MTPKEQELAYKTLVKLGENIGNLGPIGLYTPEQEYAFENMVDCMKELEILLRPEGLNKPGFWMSTNKRQRKKWGLF